MLVAASLLRKGRPPLNAAHFVAVMLPDESKQQCKQACLQLQLADALEVLLHPARQDSAGMPWASLSGDATRCSGSKSPRTGKHIAFIAFAVLLKVRLSAGDCLEAGLSHLPLPCSIKGLPLAL